nr:hypothetical protein [Treponema sp.]
AVNKMIENKTFSMKKNGKTEKYIDSLMNAKNKISYNEIIKIFKDNDGELIYKLIDLLNLLSEKDGENSWKLKTYFDSQVYFFNERELFKTIVYDYRNKNDRNYESKFIYFAYISYLLAYKPCKNDKLFKDWIRFVYNLAKNSYTLSNAVYTFCNTLRAINYLQDSNIYLSLPNKSINDIVTIDKYQLEEEILKAKLFNSPSKENIDWKAAIETSYDKLRYFEGQLYYALIDYSAITETDYNDNAKFNSFNSCVEKLSAIFNDEKEGCKPDVDVNLVKALLSKGDYLTEYNRSYSLYQNGKNRDISWLRFMKKEASSDNKRKIFKAVIDDKDFDIKDVKKSLETISNKSKANVNEEWRLKLIDKLKAFQTTNRDLENYSFGDKRLLRWNRSITNDSSNWDNWEIDLISKSTITSRHAELFTYSLYLDNKDVDIVPFGKPYYILQSSNDSMPFMVYGAFEYSGNDYFLQIFYAGNKQYELRFLNWKDDKEVPVTDKLIIKEAINAKFTASCNIYTKKVNENNVVEEIKNFSSALASCN